MANIVASGALSLGAGAACYIWGYQGICKDDVPCASAAALAVFAALSVGQKLLCQQGNTEVDTKKKKKKEKAGKKAETSSSTTESAKSNSREASSTKSTTATKSKPEAKTDKPKPETKTEKGKEQPKQTTKAQNKKDQKAKQPEKPKNTKQAVDSDSDEEGFLSLGQKKSAATASYTTSSSSVQQDDSDDSDDASTSKEPSKSSLRRRRARENKEKAAAVAAAAAPTSKKPVVDKDGFETVPITKRAPKKPSSATVETKTETKSVSVAGYSDTLDLESKQMARLIGPKGETLIALKAACDVNINTPPKDSGETKVTISGDEARVKYCKAQIRDLLSKGYCSALNPDTTSSNVPVSDSVLGIIIGPKGANIKKLQTACGVNIKINEKGGSSQVAISGAKENVAKARLCIQQIVDHGFSSVTHEGWELGEVPFPATEIRHLIGPKGQTIKSIRGDTGTQINLPKNPGENVQVIGPAAGVAKAIKQISTLLARKAAKEAAAAEAAAYEDEYGQDYQDFEEEQ